MRKNKLSTLVNKTLHSSLEEKIRVLKNAYAEAEKDPDRIKAINDWKPLDVEDWDRFLPFP